MGRTGSTTLHGVIVSFVCPSGPTPTGGVTVLYEFANALARRGHQVHLLHGEFWGRRIRSLDELSWFAFEPEVEHHLVAPGDSFGPGGNLPTSDIIFGTGNPIEEGLPVLLVQGYEMIYPWEEESAFSAPSFKICVASWLAHVGQQYGLPADQFSVVGLGIDHSRFRSTRELSDRDCRVCVLYSPHPAKGWDVALEALLRVKQVVPALTVDTFGTVAPEGDMPDWMSFTLNPSAETLVDDLYNAAAVFVQPSRYEGFGLTAVEAMACGCALVTTDNGGSRDYAFHDETAVVVPPGDVALMAAAVVDLLTDAEKRERLARAGEAFVRRFDWDIVGEELERQLEAYSSDPGPFLRPATMEPPDAGERAWGDWATWVVRGLEPVPMLEPDDIDIDPDADEDSGAATGHRPVVVTGERADGSSTPPPTEESLVLNLVWTGETIEHLGLFTRSLLRFSAAKLRFIGNACPPPELDRMERFAELHPGRVVEVMNVSPQRMIRHGDALDVVRSSRDDGEMFGFIDPDIYVRGPFLHRFLGRLADHDVITSGRELWSETNVIPEGQLGVSGEFFFDRDGFVFGSPHFAIYRRDALDETVERWGVGFATAGVEIPDRAARRIEEMGRTFLLYDTAKVINILLQADGRRLVHEEDDALVHVGGVSHFLAPPVGDRARGGDEPLWGEDADWGKWEGMADRYSVAQYAAAALSAARSGQPVPAVPDDVAPRLVDNLETLAADIEELVRVARGSL